MTDQEPVPVKRCSWCGEMKPGTREYFYGSGYKDGLAAECKECRRKYARNRNNPPVNSGVKTCARCRQSYPASTEHFYRNRYSSDGLDRHCKDCSAFLSGVKKRLLSPYKDVVAGHKRCTTCGQVKPFEDFCKAPSRTDGLTNICRGCKCAAIKRWRKAHPEKVRAYGRAWKKRNYEQVKVSEAGYRKTPRAVIRIKVNTHRRLARKRSLPSALSVQDWEASLDYFNHRCAVCGRPRGLWHTLAMDHWIPLTSPDCPGTVPENIVPLCHGDGGCNNAKSSRNPREWLVDKYGTQMAAEIEARIAEFFAKVKR